MQVCLIQHLPLDDSATLASWCKQRGHSLVRVHLPEDSLPQADGFDLLVVHGGFMSAYDEANHAWLREEKAFLKGVCERGTPVLGFCLGAQLLADALGGRARPHSCREIGWHGLRILPEGLRHPWLDLPACCTVLQWHGDTFDLPPSAVRLAESDGCARQAFAWGDNVLACQFHLEYSEENVARLLAASGDSLGHGPFVQRPEEIVPCEANAARIADYYGRILDAIARSMR